MRRPPPFSLRGAICSPGLVGSRSVDRGAIAIALVQHRLFAPPSGIYYGWVIAIYAAIVAFSSGPGQSYVFSVFLDSIIEETGFSRTGVSALYALGSGASAIMVSVVSRMADRWGPRRMLVVVGLALTSACFAIASAQGIVMFTIAFAALRALGQGSLPINATLLNAQWFVRYRGRAMAVMGLGFAASTALLPPLSRTLIDGLGWREAYAVLGVLVAVLVVPGAVFLVRNRPEDAGLLPDGERSITGGGDARQPTAPAERDGRRVLTSATFWMLAVPLAVSPLVGTALVFHQTGILAEHGLSPGVAAAIFVPYAITSAVMSVVAGVLVDRFGPRKLFVLAMALLLAALAMALVVNNTGLALVYGGLLGAMGGSSQIISAVTWAHFYGREGLGRVQGSAAMVGIAAAAMGPLPLAALEAAFGGFRPGIAMLMPLPVAAVVMMALARPPMAPGAGAGGRSSGGA